MDPRLRENENKCCDFVLLHCRCCCQFAIAQTVPSSLPFTGCRSTSKHSYLVSLFDTGRAKFLVHRILSCYGGFRHVTI